MVRLGLFNSAGNQMLSDRGYTATCVARASYRPYYRSVIREQQIAGASWARKQFANTIQRRAKMRRRRKRRRQQEEELWQARVCISELRVPGETLQYWCGSTERGIHLRGSMSKD